MQQTKLIIFRKHYIFNKKSFCIKAFDFYFRTPLKNLKKKIVL